jgi:hypothetical protein
VLWADAHEEDAVVDEEVMEPGLWKKSGWIARVIKNPDDDGWAVEMTRIGDDEPALVGPWTMGRDKKNPKPLDQPAFLTLVKTASEVLRRHEQSARARLHRSITFVDDEPSTEGSRRIRADLDLAPDDEDPHAILALFDDATSERLRSGRVAASFRLDAANVKRWMQSNGE